MTPGSCQARQQLVKGEFGRVGDDRGIRWDHDRVNVGHVLAEDCVGLEESAGGVRSVYFGAVLLGRFDARARRFLGAHYRSRVRCHLCRRSIRLLPSSPPARCAARERRPASRSCGSAWKMVGRSNGTRRLTGPLAACAGWATGPEIRGMRVSPAAMSWLRSYAPRARGAKPNRATSRPGRDKRKTVGVGTWATAPRRHRSGRR